MDRVWHNPKSPTHKTLIIHHGRVFVGSAADDQLTRVAERLAQDESPLTLLGDKAVEINDQTLRRIETEADSTEITMRYARDGRNRFTMVSLPDV